MNKREDTRNDQNECCQLIFYIIRITFGFTISPSSIIYIYIYVYRSLTRHERDTYRFSL